MAIRHLFRRFCPSILLSDTDTLDDEDNEKREGSDHTNEKHEEILRTPPSHTILSSRSSFLVLPSTTHQPVSPTDTSPLSDSNRRAVKKLSKVSVLTNDGRPSTAPSTPRSSSPRILRSIPRLGSSSPSLPLPRLSFSASQTQARTHGRRGHASAMSTLEERETPTPSLSCCSKEVAEDPFARVCPSPEFSRPSPSNVPGSSSSSRRRHASSTTPSRHRSKSSMRPSTAPTRSMDSITPVSSSASSSTLDFACIGKRSGLSSNVSSLSRSTNLHPDKDGSRKPTLPPLTTSSSASTNSSNQQPTSVSHNASSAWPMASLPSPSSPDLSLLSSSFSSSHSEFSDATFNTLDTVTTSNLSSEGNGSAGRSKQQNGRPRTNARALDVFGDTFHLMATPSPATMTIEESKLQHALDHSGSTHLASMKAISSSSNEQATLLLGLPSKPSFFTVNSEYVNTATEKKEDPFSDEAGVPDSIVRRGLEAQERLKSLRPAHAASRFIEDLHHHAGDVEEPTNMHPNVADSTATRSVDDAAFYPRFQTHLRFSAGRSFPVPKRSVTAPAAVSSLFPVMKNDRKTNKEQRNQSNSCTPTPSGPSTPRCEIDLTISPFELLNTVIAQEDGKSLQEEGQNRDRNNLVDDTDYRINRTINFSSFDLCLDNYGTDNDDRISTSIPLPQMSWFPEPTLQLPTSVSLYSRIQDNSNAFSSGKQKMIGRPATSDRNPTKIMNWNLIGRRKARISKNTIGYPSTFS